MGQKLREYENVEKILYVIIAAVGVPVNLVAIVILSRGKCGLSMCTTRYLVAMAAADLLVLITKVTLYWIRYHYFYWSFLSITPVCSVIIVLMFAATNCSVWFTVTFTFDRFIAICCQKLKTKYCTGKTAAAVLATAGVLLCLKNVPRYFTRQPRTIIDNIPWFCDSVDSYYTDPGWVAYDWFDTVLTPLLPFAVILLLNALTVRHILMASRVRKRLRGQSKGENRSDTEMESRRRSVVLLFIISGSFILLWLTTVVNFVLFLAAEYTSGRPVREPAQKFIANYDSVQHSPPQVPDVKMEDSIVERSPLGTTPAVRWQHSPPRHIRPKEKGEEVQSVYEHPMQ